MFLGTSQMFRNYFLKKFLLILLNLFLILTLEHLENDPERLENETKRLENGIEYL